MLKARANDSRAAPGLGPRRLISCIFFLFGAGLAIFTLLAAVQLVWFLWEKAPNPSIQKVGPPLGQWLTDAARFVLMDTDEKPFPWAPLPTIKA